MHILALGRTLNQIARMVHASPEGVSAIPRALVEGTQQEVRVPAAVVAKVLSASQRRWSQQ